MLNKSTIIYRNLLKSLNLTFKGDHQAINQTKDYLRNKFNNINHLSSKDEQQSELNQLVEVNQILLKNIIQGQLNNNNYNLRFTNHTELGDNTTIKQAAPSLETIKASKK